MKDFAALIKELVEICDVCKKNGKSRLRLAVGVEVVVCQHLNNMCLAKDYYETISNSSQSIIIQDTNIILDSLIIIR